MHELSIVEGLLECVRKQLKQHSFKKVLKIEVACGRWNCVSEESLNFYFHHVLEESSLADTVIRVLRYDAILHCHECQHKSFSELSCLVCPQCRSRNISITFNNDLFLHKIEVE